MVGVEDGPLVKSGLGVERVGVGDGYRGTELQGSGGHGVALALIVDGCNMIGVACIVVHLVGHSAVGRVGDNHVAGHAHHSVGERRLVIPAAVLALLGRVPRQGGLGAVGGGDEVAHLSRAVFAHEEAGLLVDAIAVAVDGLHAVSVVAGCSERVVGVGSGCARQGGHLSTVAVDVDSRQCIQCVAHVVLGGIRPSERSGVGSLGSGLTLEVCGGSGCGIVHLLVGNAEGDDLNLRGGHLPHGRLVDLSRIIVDFHQGRVANLSLGKPPKTVSSTVKLHALLVVDVVT